jgi:hypothetical protein
VNAAQYRRVSGVLEAPWCPDESTFFGRCRRELFSTSTRATASEQMLVAVLGHPFCAGEVTLDGTPGPFGFAGWIDVQDDPRDFRPVRTLRVGIEQAQISDEMFVVVTGQIARGGGLISDGGIERRLGHDHVRLVAKAGLNRVEGFFDQA